MIEIIDLINRMSPYLLLGFLLAGVMHAFVPNTLYRRYLGDSSFRAVVNAAMIGVPLPLCSCGVIPTAMSLRREGASRGATVSFLIATPQTGVDSIVATYSIMGLPFALLRPVAALVTALFGGELVNLLEREGTSGQDVDMPTPQPARSFAERVVAVLRYAFVDMMQDIGRWLILGLIVAGVITVFVPDSFFALFADNSLLSMLLVLLFAMPMYLCATGSIPIAVALVMKGLSPGTALVLLMAGPAVNAASMLLVGKVLGRRTLLLYIASIVGGAMAFGLFVDYMLPREWFIMPMEGAATCGVHAMSYVNTISSIVLALLLVNAMILRFRRKTESAQGCEACETTAIRETVYIIEGLRCNHCRSNAEKAISQLEGVESAEVELSSGRAVVRGSASAESVKAAVEALGFKLKV